MPARQELTFLAPIHMDQRPLGPVAAGLQLRAANWLHAVLKQPHFFQQRVVLIAKTQGKVRRRPGEIDFGMGGMQADIHLWMPGQPIADRRIQPF
ncbi:hypothetical protein D3C75_900830 [compost metagenome]